MIWNIVRKDVRLLWPFIIATVGLQLTSSLAMQIHVGGKIGLSLGTIGLAQFGCSALLVVLAVHQDVIPGVGQDWLARPIARRDLLLAKLLFVLITVQIPWLLARLMTDMSRPVPFSVAVWLSGALYQFISLSIPALIVASVTKSTRQAVTILLLAFVAQLIATIASYEIMRVSTGDPSYLFTQSRNREILTMVFILAAAAVVLPLQYFWRKTWLASTILAVFVLGYFAVQFIPWPSAFAKEEAFSRNPNALTPMIEGSSGLSPLSEAYIQAYASHNNAAEEKILEQMSPSEKALAAYDRHDYPLAIKLWRPLAEEGDAEAAKSIASLYVWGYRGGVPRDFTEAAKWSRVAAELRDSEAENDLSEDYRIGEGVPKDPIRAYMWLSLAADNSKGRPNTQSPSVLRKKLDTFAKANLTIAQITQAQEMAQQCKASNYKYCD